MKKFTSKIIDPIGLHARPASKIVQSISSVDDDVQIVSEFGKSANLKSIIAIMSLGIKNGEQITIEVSGSNEDETISKIKKIMTAEKLI